MRRNSLMLRQRLLHPRDLLRAHLYTMMRQNVQRVALKTISSMRRTHALAAVFSTIHHAHNMDGTCETYRPHPKKDTRAYGGPPRSRLWSNRLATMATQARVGRQAHHLKGKPWRGRCTTAQANSKQLPNPHLGGHSGKGGISC